MENVDKLIIITSADGPEFENYWMFDNSENNLVKNGRKRGSFKVTGMSRSERLERLKQIIGQNGYLVMLHLNNKEKYEPVSFVKNGELIEFFIYYYSTQDESLNDDLWSIDKNYNYTGPDEDPSCPFDKLRMDIIKGNDTSSSIREVIQWVKNKVSPLNKLDLDLNVLNLCLTPETVNEVFQLPDYHEIKEKAVEGGLTVDTYIKRHLMPDEAFSIEAHNEKLRVLRDSLLVDM